MIDTFDPQALSILRPRREEIPWRLLCLDARDEGASDITSLMRIARRDDVADGVVLGGYLLAAPQRGGLAWQILRLGVLPEARCQGLGYWLMAHAVGVAESRGASGIFVSLREDHPARKLFLRYGFEPTGAGRLSFSCEHE